jgi:MscS family membrane protein
MKHWVQLSLVVIFPILVGALSTQAADETKPALSVDKNSSAVVKTQALKDSVQQSVWVQTLEENLGQKILGISVWQYLAAFLAILAGLVLKRIILSYIQKKVESYVGKTEAEWDDELFNAIIKPVNAFVMIGAVHIAAFLLVFNLANFPTELIGKSYSIFLGLSVIWLVYRLVDVAAHYVDELLSKADEGLRGQFTPLIRRALRILVVIVGSLTILATIGINITSLIALGGVLSLAFAMGSQDSVANLIGTLNILTDRPYKVGDWITVGSTIDGDVEEIGFRSTKIRMFDKTLMSVPNGKLASETIKNWSRMPKRRIKMTLGLSYDTSAKQMKAALKEIEKILEEDKGVDQEYKLVQFTDFGASSMDVFLYYFSTSTVWKEYLDTRERVNLKIMDKVEELGLEFAFPTQTLHLKGDSLGALKEMG